MPKITIQLRTNAGVCLCPDIDTETSTIKTVKNLLFKDRKPTSADYDSLTFIYAGRQLMGKGEENFAAAVEASWGYDQQSIGKMGCIHVIFSTEKQIQRQQHQQNRFTVLCAAHKRLGKKSTLNKVFSISAIADWKLFSIIFSFTDEHYQYTAPIFFPLLWSTLNDDIKATISEQTQPVRLQAPGGKPTIANYWLTLTPNVQHAQLAIAQKEVARLASSNPESKAETGKRVESTLDCRIM